MLLSFQACPDVQGTESTGEPLNEQLTPRTIILIHISPFFHLFHVYDYVVEELTCLAAWKDGNARYLVGLVSHNHATSNEERFRCFVYEKINSNSGKYGRKLFQFYSLSSSLAKLHVCLEH